MGRHYQNTTKDFVNYKNLNFIIIQEFIPIYNMLLISSYKNKNV